MKIAVVDANAFWTEQLFRQCSRFADVLLLKPRDFRAHRARVGSIWSDREHRKIDERVQEQHLSFPPGWMVELWPWAERKVARIIKKFAGTEPLTLVITYPQYRGLIHALNPVVSVYYNQDDYRHHWRRHALRVPEWETQTVDSANLTICIAAHRVKVLREQHPRKADRIHHLPIGCTPEFMASTSDFAVAAHSPRAGYIGALNYRFDFALLAEVAARLPFVEFVLGGRVQEDGDAEWRAGLERARQQPNVKFLGWVEHTQLGQHMAGFNVLLMPYSYCNFNTNACPSKLWDYLGSGKPIVANEANPETLLYNEVVRVASTAERFASEIRCALTEDRTELRERRLAVAREHTWEKLSARLQRLLARPTQ